MIKKVAVLGAGTMGHAIANNMASHGVPVNLYESFDNVRETPGTIHLQYLGTNPLDSLYP
jgi:3-hydroxyacyl-CoA dehydrogenase